MVEEERALRIKGPIIGVAIGLVVASFGLAFESGKALAYSRPVKRAELEDLFEDHADLVAGYQRSLHQAEETIGLCIALEDQVKQLADAISALRDAVELPF